MHRYFLLISIVIVIGCKEVYNPDIDNPVTAISVQGMLTDKTGQASVIISKTVPYDSIDKATEVIGASVIIYDNLGNEFPLQESKYGKYIHPTLVAETGRLYHLKIITKEGDTYVSEEQSLPRSYNQDSIYVEEKIKLNYFTNSYGEYRRADIKGIETYVDVSSGGNELPKIFYDVRVTVMFLIPSPAGAISVWRTSNPNTIPSITSPRFEKSIGEIKKHSIGFFATSVKEYAENAILVGFWITVNKYDLNMPAYLYYLDVNDQLSASGRMFDPTPSQIIGNLKCTSNSDKKVLGFFEITKAEKFYYHLKLSGNATLIQKDSIPEFSESGESLIPPAFFY